MINVIIWGAGRLGRCALSYYHDVYNVECFVDSNSLKWGTFVEGLEIKTPEILYEFDGMVIVANKHDTDYIVNELVEKYSIESLHVFNAYSQQITLSDISGIDLENSISLRLTGGLGNQMFQYALLCAIKSKGKKVYARNITGEKELSITRAFSGVHIEEITKRDEEEIVARNTDNEDGNQFFAIYKEKLSEGTVKKAEECLTRIDSGIIQGLFQTNYFAKLVKERLIRDFSFRLPAVESLDQITRELKCCNSVAIHIRRGDYMVGNNKYVYGNICTEEYYQKAIAFIRSKVDNPIFYLFSNDIDGAKEMLAEKDIRICSIPYSDCYEDWFDMYFMSQCKHNIIANSTFSWWGAWLNQNDEKIVVAPSRWINTFDYEDIYPSDWVVID